MRISISSITMKSHFPTLSVNLPVAVVRFRHRFLEDQLDDGFQLCTALNLKSEDFSEDHPMEPWKAWLTLQVH